MIVADWIINNKNLLSKCSDYDTLLKSEKDSVEILQFVLKLERKKKKYPIELPVKLVRELYTQTRGSVYLNNEEKIVLFYEKETSIEEIKEYLQNLIIQRSELNQRFKGIIIGNLDDLIGPAPIFNSTEYSEEICNMLVSFGMTIVGGGEIFHEGLYGPIPIPNLTDIETLFFSYIIDAPESSDERIVKHGRPMIIFLLFKAGDFFTHSASLHIFLNNFLKKITPIDVNSISFNSLNSNLRSLFSSMIDPTIPELEMRTHLVNLIYNYKRRINILSDEVIKLRKINKNVKKKIET